MILTSGDVLSIDELWIPKEASLAAPYRVESRSEREIIEAALAECRGRVSGPTGAAIGLRIPLSTLEHKIKVLNIRKSQFDLPRFSLPTVTETLGLL